MKEKNLNLIDVTKQISNKNEEFKNLLLHQENDSKIMLQLQNELLILKGKVGDLELLKKNAIEHLSKNQQTLTKSENDLIQIRQYTRTSEDG